MKRLYALSFSLSFLQGLLVPVIVLYMLRLGYSEAEIGIITGSSSLLYIVGALLSSFIVSRLGDSKTIILSLNLLTAGYLLFLFSHSIVVIFIAASLVLLGFGIFWPSIENAVSSVGGKVSSFSFSWSSGSLLAMASVYPLSLVEPAFTFLFFSGLSVFLVSFAIFSHKRRIEPATPAGILGSLRKAAIAWLLCIIYSLNSSGLITFYPVLVEARKLPQILLSATLFGMIFSRTLLFYLFDRVPNKLRRLDLAALLMLTPALVVYTNDSLIHVSTALLSGIGQGIVYGIALERVFKRQSLEVHLYTSLFESFIGAGYFFGPMLGVGFSSLLRVQPIATTAFMSSVMALLAGLPLRRKES